MLGWTVLQQISLILNVNFLNQAWELLLPEITLKSRKKLEKLPECSVVITI